MWFGFCFSIAKTVSIGKCSWRSKWISSRSVKCTYRVYMSFIFYLHVFTAEILELAGNAARDNKKGRIAPRHILLAVANDEELNQVPISISVRVTCCHMNEAATVEGWKQFSLTHGWEQDYQSRSWQDCANLYASKQIRRFWNILNPLDIDFAACVACESCWNGKTWCLIFSSGTSILKENVPYGRPFPKSCRNVCFLSCWLWGPSWVWIWLTSLPPALPPPPYVWVSLAPRLVCSALTLGITCGVTSAGPVEWEGRRWHGLWIAVFRAAGKAQSASEDLFLPGPMWRWMTSFTLWKIPALSVTALNNRSVVHMKSSSSVSSQGDWQVRTEARREGKAC